MSAVCALFSFVLPCQLPDTINEFVKLLNCQHQESNIGTSEKPTRKG